ncbi:MAG: class I SAM-dependent methyltransferase [Bacilli bacterium]|jgi:16S rRNA (guanine1207-N2)-methyltransferase|nr:class I SAM-dependent methyltransferase [Bacilli bacterium]
MEETIGSDKMGHYFINDETLRSNIKETHIHIRNQEYTFYTDHGVFAKKGLDLGTHILLNTVLGESLHGDILDLGCGYGPIGISIKKEKADTNVDMVDINNRSLNLASKNASANGVAVSIFESDGYTNITKKYDYIISNPPIRVGKKILYELLFGAKEHLKPGGELWIVIHKDHGAKSTLKNLADEYQVEIKNKEKGFFIIRAVNN